MHALTINFSFFPSAFFPLGLLLRSDSIFFSMHAYSSVTGIIPVVSLWFVQNV